MCYRPYMDYRDRIARENSGFMVEVDFKYHFAEYVICKQDSISGYE